MVRLHGCSLRLTFNSIVMRDLRASVCQLLANTLYQNCAKGASLNENFDKPEAGYMVSVITGPVYDRALDVDPIEVAQFLRKELEMNASSDTYAGVWTDSETGKIYFDVFFNFSDRGDAEAFAREMKEIAIWDVVNDCEIRV